MNDTYRNGPYLGPDELNTTANLASNSHALPSLSKTCFIQPKSTGLASLFLQFGILIVSAITSMFFFYHVGGYEYMQWNENSTILEPVHHNHPQLVQNPEYSQPTIDVEEQLEITTLPALLLNTTMLPNLAAQEIEIEADDTLVSQANRSLDFIDRSIALNRNSTNNNNVRTASSPDKRETSEVQETNGSEDGLSQFFESLLGGGEKPSDNATFGIEQVPMTSITIGGVEFDWLEIIRISTLVYLAICILWMISMLLLLFFIHWELLDPTIINTFVLAFAVIYQFVHSFLIAALVFFQTEMSWRTMAITVGSIIILSCCAFLNCICFTLNIGWVKYIDYMHGKRKCICLAIIVRLIKGRENVESNQEVEEHRMANHGAPNNERQTYENVPIQQFSAF